MYCKQLKTVKFSKNSKIESIEEFTFSSSSIKSMKIPSSVKIIGKCAFKSCLQLKTIEFCYHSKLNEIDVEAFSFSSLEKIEIPSNVTKIAEHAFKGCRHLKTLKFSENSQIKSICKFAFSGSSLERVLMPSSISIIEERVFDSCLKLRTVEFLSENLFIGDFAFFLSMRLFFVSFPNATEITVSSNSFCQISRDSSIFIKPNSIFKFKNINS
ncbi:hypothetical protein M9Y10_024442 [Tritrichomonas musculus]|uniref:Surface antigen BspA-like n=1 Tax=Tritrichomonas musculus TaxID=1915356 RepID=A0ABR2HBZ5_9EUKA